MQLEFVTAGVANLEHFSSSRPPERLKSTVENAQTTANLRIGHLIHLEMLRIYLWEPDQLGYIPNFYLDSRGIRDLFERLNNVELKKVTATNRVEKNNIEKDILRDIWVAFERKHRTEAEYKLRMKY